MFTLVLDNRELKLIELLKGVTLNNFNLVIKPLKIGDILILNANIDFDIDVCSDEQLYSSVITIFERKTCQDLLASISDGRYREQKTRLLANFKLDQICYIIENEISPSLNKYSKNGRQIVIGALINKCFRDGIKIIKTGSLNETVEFLLTICKKVCSNIEFFLPKEPAGIEPYSSNIKINKKENVTPNVFSVLSLTIIPGISYKISTAIFDKYETINRLITEINLNPEKVQSDISDIQLTITNGKTRKLGKVLSARIIEFLK